MEALLIFGGPLATLCAGLLYLAGRPEHHAIAGRSPHLRRLLLGLYGPEVLSRHRHALEGGAGRPDLTKAARRLLLLDLAFPPIYGGALAAGLLVAWWKIGMPFGLSLLLLPVILAMAADWFENLVQLASRPSAVVVRLAGVATVLKLVGVTASFVLLLWLVVRVYA
ncbi:MAG: hypothetical protein KIT25_04245 [Enhydrobacter sp.]|nr:MAG: hypothetical protein KIT25_04245 [Enhydrobacter sp.]